MPIAEHLLPKNFQRFAGSLDPAFLYFDRVTPLKIEAERKFAERDALSASEKHRLVEAAKSPTGYGRQILGKLRFNLYQPAPEIRAEFVGPEPLAVIGARKSVAAQQGAQTELFQQQECHAVGSQTIIQYREWSDEWRIRTQINGTVGTAPPEQAGLRISKMLSQGGARKIADSCEFMAKTRGGFKTFVTGTFNDAARARIASGETSIQREATRALDALSKMYRRGWTSEKTGERIPGHAAPLAYCWVVEVPKNAAGENNPHLHMLFDWQVDYAHFREWSRRIESIWGNGYFHLEKIDDPLCAGAYMAKAAGYLTKAAGQSDQGTVSGNRYAISRNARAPAWSTVGTYQLGIMGMLIREVYDAISAKHSAKFIERHRLRAEREKVRAAAKAMQAADKKKRYPLVMKSALEKIGADLVMVRAEINALPVRASKYQLICKGRDAFERFLAWAAAHGWSWHARPPSHFLKRCRDRLHARKRARGALSVSALSAWVEQKREKLASALDLSAWAEYDFLMSVRTFRASDFLATNEG